MKFPVGTKVRRSHQDHLLGTVLTVRQLAETPSQFYSVEKIKRFPNDDNSWTHGPWFEDFFEVVP